MTVDVEIKEGRAQAQVLAEDQDLLAELIDLERDLGQRQVRDLTLAFEPDASMPIARLHRLGYHASGPRQYQKTLPIRRSVRFSITEKCNYRCFFCHEEGLEMQRSRHEAEDTQLFQVLEQLKTLGYNDLTFTGGEPLLKWRRILRCLDYLRHIDYHPEIKLVSNGLALQPAFIEGLQAYPGQVRFNISMHSLEPERYHQVVHALDQGAAFSRDDLSRVKANLAQLRASGIPFKLNFVLLKDINTTPEALAQIFDYALSCGARRVKFLELLITQPLKHLYPYYYRLQALHDQLADQLTYVSSGQRRSVYRYRDTPLEVELQSCTCSRGCNVCAVNRDVNFTAELRYFPCFLHPEHGTDLNSTPLAEAVENGGAYIARMARHYGDNSPIIIRDQYLTDQETAYYYEIASADREGFIKAFCSEHGLELQRHRTLSEEYFGDGSKAFARFEFVRKLARNSYDHHATEITQQHSVAADGSGRIDTVFGEDSPTVTAIDDYRQAMARAGFSIILQAQWSLDYYAAPIQVAHAMEISIGSVPGADRALVRSTQALAISSGILRPLQQPVPAWLAQG